jgi:polar amino acid transport system substrate-binding protein
LRAVIGIALLVALIGGLPGLASRATAAPTPRVVTVATYDVEPFVMTKDGVKSGFTIDVLNDIAKRTGWTYKFVEGSNVREILDDVMQKRADAAASAISITSDRAEVMDFSQPILNAGLQIIVPSSAVARSQPGLTDFLKLLFSKTMAVWLLAALALTIIPAHLIWLLERRHADSMVSKSYFPGIFQAFGWGLGMLAAAPDDAPRHWHTRVFGVFWAFVSIIFVAYYTATLTANLTVEKFDAQITSPADLVGRKVCAVSNTTAAATLKEFGVTDTSAPNINDCYAGLRKGDFEAVVSDAPLLQYYVANDGAGFAELAGPVFHHEDYGIAFPLGSELRKQADDALLSLRENGDFDLIKHKWLGEDAG